MANVNDSSTTASGWTCPRCYTWVPGGEPHVCHQSLGQSWAVYPPNYEAVLGRIADALEKIAGGINTELLMVKASPFEVEAIGIIAELVAASVANPSPKHESFDWAWNELTDSAQEQVRDAYRKAVDWLEVVSPSKAQG